MMHVVNIRTPTRQDELRIEWYSRDKICVHSIDQKGVNDVLVEPCTPIHGASIEMSDTHYM